MCGIIGIVGEKPVSDRLVDGLKRLEYRGYDSSGIAVIDGGEIKRCRAEGKIRALEDKLDSAPIDGDIGIAHTRWATHGVPNETNAHPHQSGKVAVVHNGIIENFAELRDELQKKGRKFETETDTEVIAHLIDEIMKGGEDSKAAFKKAVKRLRGAFALGVVIEGEDFILAARKGSPLVIGLGDGETYLGSDAIAVSTLTNKLIYLEERDSAILTRSGVEVFDANDQPVERATTISTGGLAAAEKGNYRHFMLKEIYEQPETTGRTLGHYVDGLHHQASAPEALDFSKIERLVIVACGTAYYAGQVAKYWFEQLAGLPVDVDIASEFRYRQPALTKGSLAMAVSQSGETADTLAALRYCAEKGLQTSALVNVMTSSMAREADVALPINAGPEIGVASTKAFTSQLIALAALAVAAGKQRGHISRDAEIRLTRALNECPRLISHALKMDPAIEEMAPDFASVEDMFYLGRGVYFPMALEGALKLKEISYIHAEGYAAGELKHGPIALIEDGTPVVVIAPYDSLFEKTVSNMQSVAARGAKIILITDEAGLAAAGDMADSAILCPTSDPIVAPIIMAIAVQLLAYHVAVHRGTDVDQPRNLAKSVTVE